mgnify:CR=1 FL=1
MEYPNYNMIEVEWSNHTLIILINFFNEVTILLGLQRIPQLSNFIFSSWPLLSIILFAQNISITAAAFRSNSCLDVMTNLPDTIMILQYLYA